MGRYKVKSSITHDDRIYQPGDTIELSEAQAAGMPWALEAINGAPPSSHEIAEAIEGQSLEHEHHKRKR
jgi:hypothetical protein